MGDFGFGRFGVDEPATLPLTASITITSTPVLLATIDFSGNPFVFNSSKVELTAAIGWQQTSGGTVPVQFSIFDTDPSTPGAVPIYQTIDETQSFNPQFTTGLIHVDTPSNNTPAYFLTANLVSGGNAIVIGPITFTAVEIGQRA